MSGEFDQVVETMIEHSKTKAVTYCDIDVQTTLKKKLDWEFRQYCILKGVQPSTGA